MRIDKTHNTNNPVNKAGLELAKEDLSQDLGLEPPVVYEKNNLQDKSQVYSLTTIEEMSQGSVDLLGQLKEMLEEMLRDQVKTLDLVKQEGKLEADIGKPYIEKVDIVEADGVKVDKNMIRVVKESIHPDRLLDEERVSQEIVDFIKQAAGGEKGKLEALRMTIDKAFNEAEEGLGLLPETSQRTYSRIMAGLRDWEEELARLRYPGWPIFSQAMNLYRRLQVYTSFGIKTYMSIILTIILLYYAVRYLIS